MLYTESDVVEYITDNDVKFIRLSFCDVFGVQKNLSIMPVELEHAFRTGVPVDASAVRGFGDEESGDVLLLSGTATGDTVFAAVYDGAQLLDAQVCAVTDGAFSLTVRAGGTVCLFMTRSGCPLTPKLTVPAA